MADAKKPEVKLALAKDKAKKPFDLSKYPKLNLKVPNYFDVKTATPLEILNLIPLNKDYDHS
jgi:hypothetical protein